MEECLGCALKDQVIILKDYIVGLIECGETDPWDIIGLLEQQNELIDKVFIFEGVVEILDQLEEF
jgi:hypothetical protein